MREGERGAAWEGARYAVSLLDRPLLGLLTLLPIVVVRALSAVTPGHDDPDLWWVAAAGREMLRTHAVPTVNAFSFVDGSQPWIMHEWLMGPPFAWGLAKLGPSFFALVALLVGAATLTIALASIARESKSMLSAWISAALVVACFSDRFATARPTGLALVFPVALLALTLRRPFRARDVLLAVLLMVLWTNAHGSFPLGIVILALGALVPGDRPMRALALALSPLATLCNPYGLRLHRFVFHYLVGDEPVFGLVHRRIAEFAPLWSAPDWAGAQVVLGLVGVFTLVVVGLSHRESRVRALACLPLLVLGVRNARHLELCGILCLMLLVPAANVVATWMGARAAPVPWIRWLAPLGGAVGLVVWATLAITRPHDDRLLGRHRPVVALAEQLPDGAHVYAPFATAGLVTWLAYPRGVLTFADSRNDCFRVSTLEAFFDLETGTVPVDLDRLLTSLDVTHALLPEGHPLVDRLRALADWRVILRDGAWTVFARTGAAPEPRR